MRGTIMKVPDIAALIRATHLLVLLPGFGAKSGCNKICPKEIGTHDRQYGSADYESEGRQAAKQQIEED
jgi:hypothetical protein